MLCYIYHVICYTTLCRYRTGARFPVLAYLHAGTPLARATPPALPRPRGRRCVEDERLVASILGDRPRGFLLELASKGGPGPAPGDTEYVSLAVYPRDTNGISRYGYPGWKRVTNKVPSLGELRESLASLTAACQDTASDKVRDHHHYNNVHVLEIP